MWRRGSRVTTGRECRQRGGRGEGGRGMRMDDVVEVKRKKEGRREREKRKRKQKTIKLE